MANAVSYAYVTDAEQRPQLIDQFAACRAYATAHSYTIVGEFNDIDEADHQATGAALAAVRGAVERGDAETVLVYQPTAEMRNRLQALGARVEDVIATDIKGARG